MVTALKTVQPRQIFSFVREDEAMKLDWLQENGFEQLSKYMMSILEVTSFDPAPYLNLLEKVAINGIEIISLRELQTRNPDWQRAVYELDYILNLDVPSPEPI